MYEGPDAQGIDKVFVLGNGPSRKNIDPSKLDGTVIGCNACYRDFTPDVICAHDAGIISDIVDSGFDGTCYFTHDSWNLLPAEVYSTVKNGSEIETKRKAGDNNFVYISGLDKNVELPQRYIIWVSEQMEHKIKNIGTEVMGWSTGTSALHIACRDYTCNDYEKVYILGFDHDNDYYDNIYTDSEHYFGKDREMRDEYYKWTKQIIKVVEEHPALQFIWVNYCGDNFPKLPNLFSRDETQI
ncbi:uncharacterized protein METZ01_LOCUS149371 [marine metagenome]|uniref:Uncharacterized protein n=1 Tax=marine metagenome TaxID=408172 RepID=A0A382A636_9ZZZZ